MLLVLFQNDLQYFPSMREVRDQLIRAQMKQIDDECKDWTYKIDFRKLKSIYYEKWKILFDLAKLKNFDRPISPKTLANPLHPITKHLLYIYSMESFIYREMNKVSRNKDRSQIQYYGAFAATLSYILYYAN